jgi:hypothetical protein
MFLSALLDTALLCCQRMTTYICPTPMRCRLYWGWLDDVHDISAIEEVVGWQHTGSSGHIRIDFGLV